MSNAVADQLERDLLQILESPVEQRLEYADSHDSTKYATVNEWESALSTALSRLNAEVEGPVQDLLVRSLHTPSVREMVDLEISRHLENSEYVVRSIGEIEEERKSLIQSNLASVQLGEFFRQEDKQEILRDIRFQLPHHNQVVNNDVGGAAPAAATVSFQIYRTINHRETKMLEVDFLATHTVYDLFSVVVNHFPETKMFDGPTYADSGVVIIGTTMYVHGSEDYSLPYRVWLDQFGIPYNIKRMDGSAIGGLEDLPRMATNAICCFAIYCGNEMVRFFISNSGLAYPVQYPLVRYRRRPARTVWCLLCKTKGADLVVLNDVLLPKNPAHTCNQCYRRLRSDGEGGFVPPGDDVIVSVFSIV